MTFLYTARKIFDQRYDERGLSWDNYIEWSRLTQLAEVVSLDRMLNDILVKPDYANADDWNYIHTDGQYQTGFFTTPEYVIRNTENKNEFNLLTVVINPNQDCKSIQLDDYEFIGYDLLDKEYGTSALTNCGGLVDTFIPTDLNRFGLIDDYGQSIAFQKSLLENNPEVNHADTNVIAVWRHKTIGRQK